MVLVECTKCIGHPPVASGSKRAERGKVARFSLLSVHLIEYSDILKQNIHKPRKNHFKV